MKKGKCFIFPNWFKVCLNMSLPCSVSQRHTLILVVLMPHGPVDLVRLGTRFDLHHAKQSGLVSRAVVNVLPIKKVLHDAAKLDRLT